MGRRGREELWRLPATATTTTTTTRTRRSRLAVGDDSSGGLGVESPGGAPPPRVGVGIARVRRVDEGGSLGGLNTRFVGIGAFWQR